MTGTEIVLLIAYYAGSLHVFSNLLLLLSHNFTP